MGYEPCPREAPFSAGVEERLYIWGGKTENFRQRKAELESSVEIFNTYQESWDTIVTKGSPPPGLYCGACTSSGQYIYTYGGRDGPSLQGTLNQLDTKTYTWKQLSSHTNNGGPMKKAGCGMVFYETKLVLFGGYISDFPTGHTQPGASYKDGQTNELHVFDLKDGTWSSPKVDGIKPPPCSGFSLTMIDDHHAVLFGGVQYYGGEKRINGIYILDLKIMNWSKLTNHDLAPSPIGRSSHAAVCLNYGRDNPQLLVIGGWDNQKKILSDAWILDLESMRWREILLQEGQKKLLKRYLHSAVSFSHSPELTEIVLFGGNNPGLFYNRVPHTTLLRFEHTTATEQWVLTDIADNSQRGTEGRIRQKREILRQITISSAATLQQPTGREMEQRVQEAEERAQLAERKLAESEQREREANWRAQSSDKKTRVAEVRLEETERRAQSSDERASLAEGQLVLAERRARISDERARLVGERLEEAERRAVEMARLAEGRLEEARISDERARLVGERLEEAERIAVEMARLAEGRLEEAHISDERARLAVERLEEAERREHALEIERREEERRYQQSVCQLHHSETQWVVRREEINLTGPELGRGGWDTVSVAMFRGVRVAAKSIHQQIISPHNIQLFRREMNMAARIRHPNLVQFIGATSEGEMLILTELMPTSLRRELEREYRLPLSQVTSISQDVAGALNYLHLMQPVSFIHRDISSANVLLEPLSNSRLKAKVSDYGSVNLQHHLHSSNPGNPIYSAPEANDPQQQSPKMDIFSFGVLLIEMLTGVLPPTDERHQLMDTIRHQPLLNLIRRCLSYHKEDRPDASNIISELNN